MHHPRIDDIIIDVYEADTSEDGVPNWADFVMEFGDPQDDQGCFDHYLSAGQAEELRASLDHELRLKHGPSIMSSLWASIDDMMARMMTGMNDGEPMDDDETDATRLRLEGMAWAMALMLSPGSPSLDAVREKAMERYHESA